MTHFYIVFSPQGNSAPSHQHATLEAADIEAKRLACKHPGREFVIMNSRYGYTTPKDANIFFLEEAIKEVEA